MTWPLVRLKYTCKVNPLPPRVADAQPVTFVPMEAVRERGGLDNSATRLGEAVRSGYTGFGEGDVLVAKITPCFENGKGTIATGLLGGVGFGTTELHVLRPSRCDGRWLFYVTQSREFMGRGEGAMYGAGGQKRVPGEFVKNLRVPTPPLHCQRAIADFLDRKTAAIDALVANKRRLVDLLTEQRDALVHQKVTRGLNPDVTLKESGVEWIRAVPAHWEVRRLKRIAARLQGRLIVQPHLYFEDEGVPIVFGYNIKQGRIDQGGLSRVSFEADAAHPHARVKAGDLLTVRLGSPGMTAMVPESLDGCHFASIMWVHQHPRVDSEWLWHVMNSTIVQAQIGAANYGATLGQFNIADAVNWLLPFPPIDEQRRIAEYLSAKLETISAAARRVQTQLGRLREYRQALITAAVTGQLDLSSEVAA